MYQVTGAERARYDVFAGVAFKECQRPLPDTLWYYTRAGTFAEIVKTKEIWSTQISCLNDHSEYQYAIGLLRKAVEPLKSSEDADTQWVMEEMDKTLTGESADNSYFYVLCMSEVEDDLSQWRAYGGGEGGVAIGLDSGKLPRRGLVSVVYSPEQQQALARKGVEATVRFFKEGLTARLGAAREEWAAAFLPVWYETIVWLAPILKDEAFKEEKEWRLVIPLRQDDLSRVRLQGRQALISRHLPIRLGETLPLRKITVGPCRHPGASRWSVITYLEGQGYPVREDREDRVVVERSRVPFQTM